jgi:Lipocalin-like domain
MMSDDPRQAIVGMWRLVHYVEFGPGGTPHYPFGQDAVGYISYSESGVMAVQMSRRQRAEHAQTPAGGQLDYLAYFGRYEVDTEKQLVRHLLEGQVSPGRHPEMLERKYRFYDDKLSLRPCDGADWEILWQRT